MCYSHVERWCIVSNTQPVQAALGMQHMVFVPFLAELGRPRCFDLDSVEDFFGYRMEV